MYSEVNQLYIYIYTHTHTHTHTHINIYPLFFRSPSHLGHHRALRSSLCSTAGSHKLSILYIVVHICAYMSIPISQFIPPPRFPSWYPYIFFSTSVSLLLLCKSVHLYFFLFCLQLSFPPIESNEYTAHGQYATWALFRGWAGGGGCREGPPQEGIREDEER